MIAEFERYLYVVFRRFWIRSRLNVFKFLVLSRYRCVFGELTLQVFAPAAELVAVGSLDLRSVVLEIDFNVILDVEACVTAGEFLTMIAEFERYLYVVFRRFWIRSRLNIFEFIVLCGYRRIFREPSFEILAPAGELVAVGSLDLRSVVLEIDFNVILELRDRKSVV